MGGGAWPLVVGDVNCLVDSDNGRDLGLLTSASYLAIAPLDSLEFVALLRRTVHFKWEEVRGNNRSVMPLDVLERTRATLTVAASLVDSSFFSEKAPRTLAGRPG